MNGSDFLRCETASMARSSAREGLEPPGARSSSKQLAESGTTFAPQSHLKGSTLAQAVKMVRLANREHRRIS